MSFIINPFVFSSGGGGGTSSVILAAEVLDFQMEESIADVGATPNVLEIEVFE